MGSTEGHLGSQQQNSNTDIKASVKNNLEFRQTFDGLERPQDSENPQRLDGADVFAFGPPVGSEHS